MQLALFFVEKAHVTSDIIFIVFSLTKTIAMNRSALASNADILRDSSHVPAAPTEWGAGRGGMRDEPLRTSA